MANLFTRPDTFFGVCEALGQDLGFDPILLRVALAVLLLWQPVAVIVGYFAVGAVVLALRLTMPNTPPAAAAVAPPTEGANDATAPTLRRAA